MADDLTPADLAYAERWMRERRIELAQTRHPLISGRWLFSTPLPLGIALASPRTFASKENAMEDLAESLRDLREAVALKREPLKLTRERLEKLREYREVLRNGQIPVEYIERVVKGGIFMDVLEAASAALDEQEGRC